MHLCHPYFSIMHDLKQASQFFYPVFLYNLLVCTSDSEYEIGTLNAKFITSLIVMIHCHIRSDLHFPRNAL